MWEPLTALTRTGALPSAAPVLSAPGGAWQPNRPAVATSVVVRVRWSNFGIGSFLPLAAGSARFREHAARDAHRLGGPGAATAEDAAERLLNWVSVGL